MRSRLSQRFGKTVRALRDAKGMSQVELSEKSGLYQTYISRIETGRANPTLNSMEVIANTLGLSIFELFDRVKSRRG